MSWFRMHLMTHPHLPPHLHCTPSMSLTLTLLHASQHDQPTPMDIANHAKLFRRVPFANRALFILNVRRLLTAYIHASQTADSAEQHRLLVDLLALPGRVLVSRRGGKQGRHRDIMAMLHRLMHMSHTDHSHPPGTSDSPVAHRPITRSVSGASVLHSISRSVALVREGHVRRAVRALASDAPLTDTSDPVKLAMLKSLHPACSTDLP